MTDFNAEAREAAKRIPDPPKAPANVVPFRRPTQTRVSTARPKPTPPQPPRAA